MSNLWLTRTIRVRPRLFSCVALGIAAYLLLPYIAPVRIVTRGILAFNLGSIIYLALAVEMIVHSDSRRMRQRAIAEDEGRMAILIFVIASAAAAITAIFAELSFAKDASPASRVDHTLLALLTVVTSWFLTHTLFALRYAHDYFLAEARELSGGLEFPGKAAPTYGDFIYFAYIVGTSAQTADVGVSTSRMRRTVLIHSVLAFFFNTALIAMTINIAAGLL